MTQEFQQLVDEVIDINSGGSAGPLFDEDCAGPAAGNR